MIPWNINNKWKKPQLYEDDLCSPWFGSNLG